MEYIVGKLTKETVTLYQKEDKTQLQVYSLNKFPEDVCVGDIYEINGEEKTLVKRSSYLTDKRDYELLEQIVYQDKYGMFSRYLDDNQFTSLIRYGKIEPAAEFGDIVTDCNLYSIGEEYGFSIIQNHKKGLKQREVTMLYIVKKVDKKYIYLLKNGEEEVIKLPKQENDFKPLDLVYLDKENDQIKIVKDDVFTPYFSNFLSKHEKEKIFNKNHFKITKWMVEYNHKHILSLIDYKTLKEIEYVPDYELYPSADRGDPYFRIELGTTVGYEWDYINAKIAVLYSSDLISNQNICDKHLSDEEKYYYYKEKVELYEERKKIFEKLNKEVEKYYQKNPLEYTKYEILDYYYVKDNYYNGTFELEPNSNCRILSTGEEEKDCIKLNDKDLPKHVRLNDEIVEVYDKEKKEKRYYFCREQMEDWFIFECEKLERIFKRCKDKRL